MGKVIQIFCGLILNFLIFVNGQNNGQNVPLAPYPNNNTQDQSGQNMSTDFSQNPELAEPKGQVINGVWIPGEIQGTHPIYQQYKSEEGGLFNYNKVFFFFYAIYSISFCVLKKKIKKSDKHENFYLAFQ